MGLRGLLLLAALAPASASAADLPSVVAAAVARSPALAQTRALRTEARAAGDEAERSQLPRLSANVSAARGSDPLFAFGALLQERGVVPADLSPSAINHPGWRTALQGALQLSLPLFTGFESTRARELARLSAREAEAFDEAAAQGLRLKAADAYLLALKDRALEAVLDARIASAEKEVAGAEALSRQGLVLGSDHQAALAILSSLRAWRARASSQRAAHDAELAVLSGAPVLELTGLLGDWKPDVGQDAALAAAALERRSDLRAARSRLEGTGLREKGAAQSLLPRVDAFAALQTTADGLNTGASAGLLGVRAAMTFGDPAYAARLAGARARTEASGAECARLEDQIRAEVRAHAAALRGLADALPHLKEALDQARRSLGSVLPLYREGRQSIMEVLRAEEAVARLEEARLEALYALRSEWLALRAAQGELDDPAISAVARSLEAVP